MSKARLNRIAFVFPILLTTNLSLAQSANMQTMGPCSSIVSGENASGTSYCIGITKDALERLSNISAVTQGRRLFISEAWLTPTPLFGKPEFGKQAVNEQVFLSIRATNITAAPIVLTAGKWETMEARNLSKGGGIYGSRNSLWPAISLNKPIKIEAGEQVEIEFGEGMELRGMASQLRKNRDIENAYIVPGVKPTRINGTKYTNWFAEQMALLYGARSKLRLTLYEGDYKPIASVSLPLVQGVDFFYHGEAVDQSGKVQYSPRLAYDAFLGQYLEMREKMEPGFHINTPQTKTIEVIPDPTVWGKYKYKDLETQGQK